MDQAVASDILWVNSAGNDAEGTWFGPYSDPDGDGSLGFGDQNDEIIDLPLGTAEGIDSSCGGKTAGRGQLLTWTSIS